MFKTFLKSTKWIVIAHAGAHLQVSANVQCQYSRCTTMCVHYIFHSVFCLQSSEIACVPVHAHVLLCLRNKVRQSKTEREKERERVCVVCVAAVRREIAEDLQVLHDNEKRDTNSFICCSIIMVSMAQSGTHSQIYVLLCYECVCVCVCMCVSERERK